MNKGKPTNKSTPKRLKYKFGGAMVIKVIRILFQIMTLCCIEKMMPGLKLNFLYSSNQIMEDTSSTIFFYVNAGNCCYDSSKLWVK